MKIKEIGEFGLIGKMTAKLPPLSGNVIKGIGDDTAVLRHEPGQSLLMTTDMIVEDIHFSLKYGTYRAAGWRALAVNVSDIAAMGGTPTSAVVSLAVPPGAVVKDIEDLYTGIGECAHQYGVDIVGGDTVKSTGGLAVNITLLGTVDSQRAVYRSGAVPGDVIMVTGSLGHSAAGLYTFNNSIEGVPQAVLEEVKHSHLFPSARSWEGKALGQSGLVSSMNDISDGLASEVLEICEASGTGCELYRDKVPFSQATALIAETAGIDPVDWALYGGEDFELVFTVNPQNVEKVTTMLKEGGCSPVVVGKILPEKEDCLLINHENKTALKPGGFNHFRD